MIRESGNDGFSSHHPQLLSWFLSSWYQEVLPAESYSAKLHLIAHSDHDELHSGNSGSENKPLLHNYNL